MHFKKFYLFTTLLFATLLFTTTSALADRPAVHGMLLFGKNATYVSHLPMFHAPHDYQFVSEVEVVDFESQDVEQEYVAIKAATESYLSIAPAPMDLSKVISAEITTFPAKIYNGHFERGGTLIGSATVKISNVILQQKIVPVDTVGTKQTYKVFGKDNEYYAVHQINGVPAFDAVLTMTKPHFMMPVCNRVECTPAGPVPDAKLPMFMSTLDAFPQVGKHLTSNVTRASASISKILYVEEDELKP